MKISIKQKVFSWREKYFIEDEFISLGNKMHFYVIYEKEVAFIAQQVFSFLSRYFMYVGDNMVVKDIHYIKVIDALG